MAGMGWLRIGAISGFLAVALGAFGAHGLRDHFKVNENDPYEVKVRNERMMENFETGARYQMYHALALVAVAVVSVVGKSGKSVCVAGWAFVLGTILFSGSLYVLVLTGQRWLGAITPFGGGAFLVGWAALALAASRPKAV